MNAANGKPFEKNLDDVVDVYKDDLDKFSWKLNSACYLFCSVEKMAKQVWKILLSI